MTYRDHRFQPGARFLALEPRLLFDGAAAAAVEHQAPAAPAQESAEAVTPPSTLAIVDSRLNNAGQLADEVGRNAKVIVVGAAEDGLAAITQALQEAGTVDAIQIYSHGATGQLKLGSTLLSAGNVADASGQLQDWAAHLSPDADILLFGCNTGAGAAGKTLISTLAALTGADVAASTNDTGSHGAGGDWRLEVATGSIESTVPELQYAGLLAAGPTVTLSAGAIETLLGGQFSFTLNFSNAAGDVGFAPFIDLVLPATGKDGAGAEIDDGITFVSATYLGQAVVAQVLTFDASGNATHPLAKDATGANVIVNAATFGAQAGDQLVVLVVPYASVLDGQPDIPIVVTAQMSNLADTEGSPDLVISARGGFQFGNDSADNPITDPSLIEGSVHDITVHPTVLTLTQSISAPEGETATGPNYERTITVTATPAPGQTLTNVDITQSLPDTIRIADIAPGAGGSVISITQANGGVLDDPAVIPAYLQQEKPYLTSYTVRYASLSAAATTVVSFYVPDVDFSGAPVLDPVTGDDRTITVGAPVASAQWVPVDPRDQATAGDPPAVVPIELTAMGGTAAITAKSITLRKSVAIVTNAGSAGVSPGDTLEYTLEINLSDYFAFGRTLLGVGGFTITDSLGDGQQLVPGPIIGTLFFEGDSVSAPMVVTVASGPGNTTVLTIDIAETLAGNNRPFPAHVGDVAFDGLVEGATRGVITYRATITQAYATAYNQSEINEGDGLGNDAITTGTVLPNPITAGDTESDTSSASVTVPTHAVAPVILSINGNTTIPPIVELRPGDIVVFKLAYDLQTGDYENFSLTSYLPLPLFDLADVAFSTPNQGTAVGQWTYGSDNTNADLVDSVTEGPGNSLVFNFGSFVNTGLSGSRIEVQYTLEVGNDPFPDQRSLTILSQSDQLTTIVHDPLASSGVITIASIAEPVLAMKHGVVAVGAGSAGLVVFTGATATWVPVEDGGAPFTGTITDIAAVDGSVINIDAGDIVRLATAIENTGGLGAFDVATGVTLPAGLSFVGNSLANANVKVYRGDGTALVLNTDYSVSGNTIMFLDPGTPGSPSLLPGRTGTANDTSGANIVVITYDAVADATVAASQNFETSAALTNFSSTNNGPDFSRDDLTDKATESVAAPVIAKVFADGTLTPDDSSAAHTTGADLVIGEAMLSDIVVTLPEGVTQSLRVNDLIPDGLKLDTAFGSGGYQIITAAGGALTTNFAGTVTVGSAGAPGGNGADLNLTFSASSATGDNVAGNNSFVIRVRLIADNVAANQAGESRTNDAQLVYSDPDTDTPNGSTAVDRTVALTGTAPTVTIREPTLVITQTQVNTGPPIGVDRDDIITYTIRIANNSGGTDFNAYDITFGDALPNVLAFFGPGLGLLSVTYGGGAANNGGADFILAGNDLVTATGANIDIPTGGSIELVVAGRVRTDLGFDTEIINLATVQWTSLDGSNGDERTGFDGLLDGGTLNDYRASAATVIPVAAAATISHVGGLADTPAPAPTTAQPETVAVGEIIYYRAAFLIPEGDTPDVSFVLNLPEGLSLVAGAPMRLSLVSNGNGLSSNLSLSATSAALEASPSGEVQTLLAADLSNASTAVLTPGLIDATNPRAIRVTLGNLTNNNLDADFEGVYLEFSVRVDNIAALDTSDSLSVRADYFSGPVLQTVTPLAVENVVEPDLRNLQKTVTDFNPRPAQATGIATVALDFANNGDGIAYEAHLSDMMTDGSNYAVTAVIINGTSLTPVALPAGVSVGIVAANGGITADFASIAVGASIRVVYTVEVPNDAAKASTDATLNWSSLPETYTGGQGAAVGPDASPSGERDGSGNTTPPNTYIVSEGAGLGFIQGMLWDDTASATTSVAPDGPGLAGQTVTLTWAGADGNISTAGDNATFTATTDAGGNYHFGVLAAGTYRIDAPNPIEDYVFGADTDSPAARIDTDAGTLATVTVSVLGEGATAAASVGYVRENDAPENTVPDPQTVDEDTLLAIGGISVADLDADPADMDVRLSVRHGKLNFTSTAGVAVTGGALNSATVTIRGSQSALNTVLATLQYMPDLNYNSGYQGDDVLTVTTSDLSHTGDFNGNGTPGEPADARTDTDTVTIHINPVNDPPTANPNSALAVEKGGTFNDVPGLSPTGNLLQNDTDVDIVTNGDVLTVTLIRRETAPGGSDTVVGSNTQVIGAYGTLTISSNGSTSYVVADTDPVVQALRLAGNTLVDTFIYTMRDLAGVTSSALFTVTVRGANDNPVAVDDDNAGDVVKEAGVQPGGNVPEPGDASAAGNVLDNDTDVDLNGETRQVVGVIPGDEPGLLTGVPGGGNAVVIGTYGTLTMHSDGSYTYVLNDADADTDALAQGDSLTDTFTYIVGDALGATDSARLVITIEGTNDVPVPVPDTNAGDAVTEAGVNPGTTPFAGDPSANGNVLTNDTDVDIGDTRLVTTTGSFTGTYGTLTLDAAGVWTYTLDNADADTDALAQGQVATEVFNYTIVDAAGATASSNLTITITGTNDMPIVAATDVTGAVTELVTPVGNLTDTGTIAFTDVDLLDVHSIGAVTPSVGALGALTASVSTDTTGSGLGGVVTWNYTVAAAAVEYLAVGETKVETFSFDVSDGNGGVVNRTVTVTITGTNDVPIVATTDVTGAVTEAVTPVGNLTDTGTIAFTDVDLLDVHSVGVVTPSVGALGALTASVSTDTTGSGLGGVVTWNYTVAAALVEYLQAGQTSVETFSFDVNDGKGGTVNRTVTVTITGTNDVPIVATTDVTGAVTELVTPVGNLTDTGTIAFSDVDLADSHTISPTIAPSAGALGTLTASVSTQASDVDGMGGVITWNYSVAAAAVEFLAEGQTKVETFDITLDDAHGGTVVRTITVTITGTEDTPVVNPNTNGDDAVTEAGVNPGNTPFAGDASASGNVLTDDTDVDTGDNLTVTTTGTFVGIYGAVTIDAAGNWTYALDNADPDTEALAHGQVVTGIFNYTVMDALGATASSTLSVTITGTNDAPIAVDDANAVKEAGVQPGGNVPEPGNASATGDVLANDTDVDTGDTRTVTTPGSFLGTYGTLTLLANGSYTYALDNADPETDALAQGQVITDVFTYTMTDANGAISSANLTITIVGTNDVPIAADNFAIGRQAGPILGIPPINPSGNILLNDTDVDNGDAMEVISFETTGGVPGTLGTALVSKYGSLTVNADGSALYVLDPTNPDVQALRTVSDRLTDIFNYTMRDTAGATSTALLTVIILGADELPVAVDDIAITVEAGGVGNGTAGSNGIGNVLDNDTDADVGDTRTVIEARTGGEAGSGTAIALGNTIAATYGSFTLNADGSYTYVVDNNNAAVEALRTSSDTLTDTFTYTVTDIVGGTDVGQLVVTIQGANDDPMAFDDTAIAQQFGVVLGRPAFNPAGNVLPNDTDIDDYGETQAVIALATSAGTPGTPGVALPGAYGTLTLNADGSYSYLLDTENPVVKPLRNAQETLIDRFTYTMRDAAGATSTANLTVTIIGANDPPVAVDDANFASDIAGPAFAEGDVLPNDFDPDPADSKTVLAVRTGTEAGTGVEGTLGSVLQGRYGTLVLNADGSYRYVVDASNPEVLASGGRGPILQDVFTYTLRDTAGATDQAALVITIETEAPFQGVPTEGFFGPDSVFLTGDELRLPDIDPVVYVDRIANLINFFQTLLDRRSEGAYPRLTVRPEIQSITINEHLGGDLGSFVHLAIREIQFIDAFDTTRIEARHGIVTLSADGLLEGDFFFDPTLGPEVAQPVADRSPLERAAAVDQASTVELVVEETSAESSEFHAALSFSEQLRQAAQRIRPLGRMT